MPKIKFTETQTVVNEGKEKVFKEGSTHDLPEPSCQRWEKRGVASRVGGEKRAAPSPAKNETSKDDDPAKGKEK